MERNPEWTGFYVVHDPVTSNTHGPSMTRQEFAAECDINTIMKQYDETGVISHVNPREPMYIDLSESPRDLVHAMAILDGARDSFASLPASVRRSFDNDPLQFVAFVESNTDEAKQSLERWGLTKPKPPAPEPVEVVIKGDPKAAPAAPVTAPGAVPAA